MKLSKKIITGAILLLPLVSMAAVNVQPGDRDIRTDDVYRIIDRVTNFIATIFFTVSVLFVFWAGYKYLKSGGEPEKITEARDTLIYAMVAIAIGILAFSFPRFVENLILR